jgi:hypothetical protein
MKKRGGIKPTLVFWAGLIALVVLFLILLAIYQKIFQKGLV